MSKKQSKKLRLFAILLPALVVGLYFASSSRISELCHRCDALHEVHSIGWGLLKQESYHNSERSRGCDHEWADEAHG